MVAIEILAVIFAILVLVKLLFIIFSPNTWLGIVEPLLENKLVATLIYLILALIVGYYVLLSLSIVEVAAVMLFTSLLIGLAWIPYSDDVIKLRKEMLNKRNVVSKNWLSIIIWIVIALWVLYTVFAK